MVCGFAFAAGVRVILVLRQCQQNASAMGPSFMLFCLAYSAVILIDACPSLWCNANNLLFDPVSYVYLPIFANCSRAIRVAVSFGGGCDCISFCNCSLSSGSM